MKPRILRYRTFAEIADEMAKKRHGEWYRARRDDYLEPLIQDFWFGRFMDNTGQSCVFDLDPRQTDAPASVARENVWRRLGCYKPQTVREVPEGSPPPCKILAAAKIEEYGGEVVRDLFENFALSEADARAWMRQYDEENLPRIQFGGQHPTNSGAGPYRTGAPSRPTVTRPRGRRRRARDPAKRALDTLYPKEIPLKPWKTLHGEVNDWLAENDELPVSVDTVRRAANRK